MRQAPALDLDRALELGQPLGLGRPAPPPPRLVGVADEDPATKAAMLTKGISEAMNATAFGLITSIFTMVCHSILSNRASKLLSDVDEYGVKLMDTVSAHKYRSQPD